MRFIDDDRVLQVGIHGETMLGEHYEVIPEYGLPGGNGI